MKSLLAAVNLLTVAFGNLMVVIVSEVRYFENQVRKNYYKGHFCVFRLFRASDFKTDTHNLYYLFNIYVLLLLLILCK